MRYSVDGGHLGKWRRVRIARTSDNVITQFHDPHTSMIGFRHADKCWYSAAGTLLFWGPPLQHYLCVVYLFCYCLIVHFTFFVYRCHTSNTKYVLYLSVVIRISRIFGSIH